MALIQIIPSQAIIYPGIKVGPGHEAINAINLLGFVEDPIAGGGPYAGAA